MELSEIFTPPGPTGLRKSIGIGDKLALDKDARKRRYVVTCPDAEHLVLINLESGHRFTDMVEIEDTCCISKADVEELIGNTTLGMWEKYADGDPNG